MVRISGATRQDVASNPPGALPDDAARYAQAERCGQQKP